ncbi:MAG: MarR family transcriptional regulator [Pseudomonadota bacterium]
MASLPQSAPSLDLLTALRDLHVTLDHFDADIAAQLGLARNDLKCVHLLVAEGSASPKRIMAQLALTSGTVTTLIDRLEAQGWARRLPDPKDRRGVRVEPTRKAKRDLAGLYGPMSEVIGKFEGRLGEERSQSAAKQVNNCTRLVAWAQTQLRD